MTVEEYVEAFARGERPTVPQELREEVSRALAGLGAIQVALAETAVQRGEAKERGLPALPEDYAIVRELGRGGMGVVYLARQRSLDRLVAVKVLRPGEIAFGPIVRRFVEEARHLARLRHPNIVAIHETGQAGDEPYFTMDYVEGAPLSARIKQGPLSATQAVMILAQACEAVEHAHRQGIVHRDLKPANILLDAAGRAYVTDFGLARDLSRESSLTGSGDVLGTPAYMAPEQANGETARIGERTDVWALGVILYEMLTGESPYGHGAPVQVLARLLRDEPLPPRKANPRVPRDLETVCLKAMEKDPERRYATVHAMLEDLRRFEVGEPVHARRPSRMARLTRTARRHWRALAASTLVAAAALVAGYFLFDRGVEDLVVAAEEQHAAGNHAQAVQLLCKALWKVPKSRIDALMARAVRCCSELGDEPQGVSAWVDLGDTARERTAGRHDLTIARTIIRQVDMKGRGGQIEWPSPALNRLPTARWRLEGYLKGGFGSPAEREEATKLLIAVQLMYQKARAVADAKAAEPKPTAADLPKGTLEELDRMAGDKGRCDWERGKAAYVAATEREKKGDREAALASIRQAVALVRKGYPICQMTVPLDDTGSQFPADGSEPKLVREIYAAERRLDPSIPEPRGGIRLRIVGVTFPPGIQVSLQAWINEEGYNPGGKSEGKTPSPDCALDANGTTWIGLPDGKYRLLVRRNGIAYNPVTEEDLNRFWELFVIDSEDPLGHESLPGESYPELFRDPEIHVEVKGGTVDVPIKARLLTAIRTKEPAEGCTFDLETGEFSWTPVEGAAWYKLTLFARVPRVVNDPNSSLNGATMDCATGSWVNCDSNRVCLGKLPPNAMAPNLRAALVTGRTVSWDVTAFDAAGQRIGTSVGTDPRFVVARGLDGK